mgnify:CR=1 FL=1
MGAAIGQALPVAVGITISPLPVVAVALMLVSSRPRANALTFLAAWSVTVAAVIVVVALVAGQPTGSGHDPAPWTGWLRIALGAALLLLALRRWRARPRGDGAPDQPRWMSAVESFTPVRSAGLAALLAGVNPKNLLLAVSAGVSVAGATADTTATLVAAVVLAAVASLGVVAPVVVYLAAGDRAGPRLEEIRTWLVRHDAVIMAVLLVVLGAKLIGDGINVL